MICRNICPLWCNARVLLKKDKDDSRKDVCSKICSQLIKTKLIQGVKTLKGRGGGIFDRQE